MRWAVLATSEPNSPGSAFGGTHDAFPGGQVPGGIIALSRSISEPKTHNDQARENLGRLQT
ncbi:hypothetical protein AOC05_08515 [Arthrobacter alpinus]|uniref:Uncharacterized protein n=1 Tax=Arthrobacter alpinus TaxID=656366 RepID=A0A0M4QYF8_9MICC|nr:hypothetical protein AOC05_08515 [Arthrobacter alpinus]